MQPINYSVDVKNPFASALGGIESGLAVAGAIDKVKQQDLALRQQQQMQTDLSALAANPTPQGIVQASIKYPQLSEHFKRANDILAPQLQQATISRLAPVYFAAQSGNTDVAQQKLLEHATALENSGMMQDAKEARDMAELIRMSPGSATTMLGGYLSAAMGPEKFLSTFSGLAKLPGEVRKGEAEATKAAWEAKDTPQRLELANLQTAANIRSLDSQISERSQRLGLDRDKAQSDVDLRLLELNQKGGKLDDSAIKIVNDSTVASVTAKQSAGQMTDLANRLEQQGGGYGVFSTAGEWLKKATGNQDSMTSMRQEYVRLRNTQAVKNMPPGAASDKDVALALKGFPEDTADAKTVASFLRGMAKLQDYTASMESAKAEWVNAVGHLGKPRQDIEVDGIKVPAGSTFADFANQYMGALAGKQSTQAAQQAVPNRSYMRWAASPQGQPTQPGQLGSGTFNFGQ